MIVVVKLVMEYFVGRKFVEKDIFEGVMSVLGYDFDMQFSVFGGMVFYCKVFVFGFFYRFYYDVFIIFDGQSDYVDKQVIDEVE